MLRLDVPLLTDPALRGASEQLAGVVLGAVDARNAVMRRLGAATIDRSDLARRLARPCPEGVVLEDVELFETEGDDDAREADEAFAVQVLGFGFGRYNEAVRRTHPETPRIYDPALALRWVCEPFGERWRSIESVLRDDEGCCKDLAAALLGELLADGISAVLVLKRVSLPTGYHVTVERADGGYLEDPSVMLGMIA